MRVLKFRRAYFHYSDDSFAGFSEWGSHYDSQGIPTGFIAPSSWSNAKGKVDQQFTGFYDKKGVEVYEGDIFRVEEDGAEEGTDMIYYLVIVWIKEWGMFGTLRYHDEYKKYLMEGIKALDEPMFWTYTLEDTNDRRFYLDGNIYSNSKLFHNEKL